ncbi:MAG TPA: hypothetical protein VGR47_01980 [Terracidiphilus sp.]|nr:hypothetical protein [Terracidiphilus sp.]
MRILVNCVAIFVLSIPSIAGAASRSPADSTNYHHAYYLFVEGIKGCENCYVPLLITNEPLEQIAKSGENQTSVLIVTYERDSVWHDDGTVSVEPKAIEAPERIIHLRDRTYRYQEISSSEVVKLLQNPMGTIPISRPVLPNASSPGPTFKELIATFEREK